jgi:hypothetical protein
MLSHHVEKREGERYIASDFFCGNCVEEICRRRVGKSKLYLRRRTAPTPVLQWSATSPGLWSSHRSFAQTGEPVEEHVAEPDNQCEQQQSNDRTDEPKGNRYDFHVCKHDDFHTFPSKKPDSTHRGDCLLPPYISTFGRNCNVRHPHLVTPVTSKRVNRELGAEFI